MSVFVRSYKRRRLFLTSLEAGDSESAAARNAGGTVGQFKKWRKEDENFDRDCTDAIEAGTDFIEDIATDRAMKKSDVLMVKILEARRPDKYRRSNAAGVEVNINVEGSKAKLLNRLARLRDQGKEQEEVRELEAEKRQEEEIKKLPPPESVGAAKADRGSRGTKRRQTIGGGRVDAEE